MPALARVVVAALLIAFVLQAGVAAVRDSVTIDEFVHLPLGLYFLRTGDFHTDPINPPHTRMFAALPLLVAPPTFSPPPGAATWVMGYQFESANPRRYQEYFERGRAMILVLAVVLAWLVFRWARRLFGWQAGLVALFLYAFSPTLLAHGHLVTVDLAGALGFTWTAYAAWRLLDEATTRRALLLGLAMGVASLLKLSGFLLALVVVTLLAVRALERPRRPATWGRVLAIAALAALLVVNAGYRFDGTMAALGSAHLDAGGLLGRLQSGAPWLRLPLPMPMIEGIDLVMNSGKQQQPVFYLAGRLSAGGWWYYHLAAFGWKTPIPLLAALAAALAAWVRRRGAGRRAYCLYLPIALVFLANALFNSLQIGVRHVLPVYPLAFVAVSGPLAAWLFARGGDRGAWLRRGVAGAALLWFAAGSLAVAPRYLQYFNELGGGPEGGHRYLIDSNLDWGQDLIRLHDYMEEHDVPQVSLAYFGRAEPAIYGVRYVPLERGAAHGTVVVSASFLMGRPYFWLEGGTLRWVPAGTYTWLQSATPVARVGALFVFDLP